LNSYSQASSLLKSTRYNKRVHRSADSGVRVNTSVSSSAPGDAGRYAASAKCADYLVAAPSRARISTTFHLRGLGTYHHTRARQSPVGHGAASCLGRHNNRMQRSAGSEFCMLQSMPLPRPMMRDVRRAYASLINDDYILGRRLHAFGTIPPQMAVD
jgi:hypothetical protein